MKGDDAITFTYLLYRYIRIILKFPGGLRTSMFENAITIKVNTLRYRWDMLQLKLIYKQCIPYVHTVDVCATGEEKGKPATVVFGIDTCTYVHVQAVAKK